MNFDFDLYHNILFLGLHPKNNHLKNDAFFKEQMLSIKKEFYQFQPIYNIDFEAPFTEKRKYYLKLIDHEAIKYLNNVYSEFNNATSTNEKKYLFNSFQKIITQKFKEIHTHCTLEGYTYDKLTRGVDDEKVEDELFVILFLKTELIRIYLEIAEKFAEYNSNDSFTETNIYKHFFKEKQPSPSLLVEAEPIITTIEITPKEQEKKRDFIAIKNDFKPVPKHVLTYDIIVAQPDYFSIFEEALHTHGLINPDYVFIEDRGNKKTMGIIYAIIINKNYFHKRNFKESKAIKPIDIKRFLNNRYATNIDKEFRNAQIDHDAIRAYLDENFWIEGLKSFK